MISEIDIRDWTKSIAGVKKAVDSLGGLPSPYPYEQMITIEGFIEKVEAYIYSHEKQVAAILRAPDEFLKEVHLNEHD